MKEMIFTIPEVAEFLKLSQSKVYLLVQTGQLPHIRIGRNVRIKESDLYRWIDQHSWVPEEDFLHNMPGDPKKKVL